MSRIGKLPITIEKGVDVSISDTNVVTVKGGKSSEVINVNPCLTVKMEDGAVTLTRNNEEAQTRAYHGLYRTLISNAVLGVTKGWSKTLELNGVGYRSSVKGKALELNLGYSHPISYNIPEGIQIKVEKNTTVHVSGSSKALVGQVAAKILSLIHI